MTRTGDIHGPEAPPKIRGLVFLCLAAAGLLPGAGAEDILRPEQAFRYELHQENGELIVDWQIEPGHYLYRERMSFASKSAGLELADAIYPAGLPHEDEFFGEMEIYRDEATVRIPIRRRAPELRDAVLEIRSQGCADIGLCYPPQRWEASVTLASAPATGKASRTNPATADSGKLSALMNRQPRGLVDEPLPPDIAFEPSVSIVDAFKIRISWFIAEGYYLYRDSIAVTGSGSFAQPGPPAIPAGTPHVDEHFGQTSVFRDSLTIEVPLTRPTPDAGILTLTLEFQGCKEDSICYPPQVVFLDVELPVATVADAPGSSFPDQPVISEQARLSKMILEGNAFLVLVTFLGLGLLLAFTPCVLPMVPILSGIIAGQGKDVTTGKAFALSLTYVMGMAITYTAAGAAFGAMGGQIQAALQKPWIIVGVAALFVALALSMFGLYELQMPAVVQTRLSALSNRQRSGTYLGTAIMGVLSALVVTTCVAPPLVASMTVIAQAGDVVRGASALFAMSIGMGIPLLVVGTSAGRWLPKAGAWMDGIKRAFGFMMLGLAIWMLERILPGAVTMALWAILVFMAGIFLGAFQGLGPQAPPIRKFARGAGLLATLYGATLLLGALGGSGNPLQPLSFLRSAQESPGLEFKRIKSVDDLDAELALARSSGKPVMLDFYADWCVSCKEMEHYTFVDDRVRQSLSRAVLLQADVTANDDEDQALLAKFGIFGPPTIVFFDATGQEEPGYRVVGFMPADQFAAHVNRALDDQLMGTAKL